MGEPGGAVLGGRYVLAEKIGAGGFSEVWCATDLVLSRPVAIKLLHLCDAEALTRFRAEAQHTGRLSHENIARIYDYGEPAPPQPPFLVMELVAGSHSGPWLMPRTFLSGEARWFPEGSLAELPDIDADRDAYDIRRFELAPGDAIFFDFLTVHGAPGFPFPGARRVLSLRYLSAGVTFAPRRWRTSPPFDGLDRELAAGSGPDHPLFPVVWPADGEARGVVNSMAAG